MIKVLWLVSMTLPQAADACGLGSASDVSGSWLTSALCALRPHFNALQIAVCSIDSRVKAAATGTAEGVAYHLLPSTADFAALLQQSAPDLVHIWGTEYPAVAEMQWAAEKAKLPVLYSVQGVMQDCAAHLCDGVPPQYLSSNPIQRFIDKIIPGALLDQSQARFDALAAAEAGVLRRARYVTGRTAFDAAATAQLAPNARYYPCNETLRPLFYTGAAWHAREFGRAPVILLTQGNYPLKNLHTLLQAMPLVLKRWPGATLRIAGWPPLERGALLQPVIDWMFPYQRYCKKLIAELGLHHAVQYTGPLDAAAMRQAYLDADVFVLPSLSENSPNSLGEAMLLGMPCVAAEVGGIPSMLQNGVEGVLYTPALDAEALGAALAAVLSLPDGGAALGGAARARALQKHDAAQNAAALLGIYQSMAQSIGGSAAGKEGAAL